jgi:glutamate racemase
MGQDVTLVDSAQEVALKVKDVLKEAGLSKTAQKNGKLRFLISDKPQEFKKIARQFLGFNIKHVKEIKDN